MPDEQEQDAAVEACVGGICDEVKAARGKTRDVIRRILFALTPVLVRSPDPRVKALGLALAAGSAIFLKQDKRRVK